MSLVQFEISKILNKRFSLILLVVTIILFPVLIKVISHLSVTEDGVPEGLFAEQVAYGILSISQTPLFLPVWIIIFTGLEMSNGHVNRVVFAKSRKYYFLSKIIYCGIITAGFCFIGLISLIIAVNTSPFQQLTVNQIFYWEFLLQLAFSIFGYSIILLGVTFFFRSPGLAFIIYYGWTFVEGIIFILVRSRYDVEMKWLPFHLIRTLYTSNGVMASENYYNPFIENITSIIAPIGFISFIACVTFYFFSRSNLKPLSD